MKWAFPECAFGRLADGTVAVQIAIPFSMFRVAEMAERPVVHGPVPLGIFRFTGQIKCQKCGNDGFIMRPPEFHIVPVFLHRLIQNVSEIPPRSLDSSRINQAHSKAWPGLSIRPSAWFTKLPSGATFSSTASSSGCMKY